VFRFLANIKINKREHCSRVSRLSDTRYLASESKIAKFHNFSCISNVHTDSRTDGHDQFDSTVAPDQEYICILYMVGNLLHTF